MYQLQKTRGGELPNRKHPCRTQRIDELRVSISPNFRLRPSTSVLLKVESFLYPQSYCSLDPTQIHSFFTEEDRFDWFRTPHYPPLFHSPPAHYPLHSSTPASCSHPLSPS